MLETMHKLWARPLPRTSRTAGPIRRSDSNGFHINREQLDYNHQNHCYKHNITIVATIVQPSMLLILDVQVLQDVNKILCPYTTLKQDVWLTRGIISVLENGVEEVELILEFRQRFCFWGALKIGHAVGMGSTLPCERDVSRRGM